MKNKDGSDSNVKFVSEATKKKTKKKGSTPVPKTANRKTGSSNIGVGALATALTNSAKSFKGLNNLSESDISRQFGIARGMIDTFKGLEQGSGRKKKKENPVAKGFAQDKRIRADKAKEKKAFSKKK